MAIFNVSDATQLQAALGSAVGGDRIVLSPGDYGSVTIQNRHYASTVTIQTSNLSNRAHLDGLFISKSSNLTVTGLDLGRALNEGEAAKTAHLNKVTDSANIRFSNVQIHGSVDNDPSNDGFGMLVTRVNGFRIDNSSLTDLFRGVSIQQSSNATLLSNDFETIRSDGVTVASTSTILIDKNSFKDFRPITGDHSDAIQFWNTGQTVGSSNITIRNNVIAPGSDDYAVQGIFISDPGTLGYKNVKVTNNLIYSHGAYHGVTVEGATGLQVIGNSLLSQSGDTKKMWIQLNNSKTVTLSGNVAEDILLKNVTGLTQSGNWDLSIDPSLRSLIPNVDTPATLADLIVPGVGFQAPLASAALTTLYEESEEFWGSLPILSAQDWYMNAFVALP